MRRRDFITLFGGGIIAAVLPGCSTDFPEPAVAAWKGPAEESDLRRWALGYAILAPSAHNRQPWIADLREPSAITLFVDRARLLPETDPWFRQIMVSQGTFLEALVIALRERGIEPQVQLFPQGEFEARALDDRPVARVAWQPNSPPPAKDPLFRQLLRRHTAKVAYDTSRSVAPSTLEALRRSTVDRKVHVGATIDPTLVVKLRELCWQSAEVELHTPRTVMESIRLVRVGPDEILQHRDGISMNGRMLRLLNTLGALDRSAPPAKGSAGYKQMMSRFVSQIETAMGFVWLSTPSAEHSSARTTRSAEVRAGRAYMRLQLKATELGLQVHPMSQAAQEFPEMKPHYDRLHALLGSPATVTSPVQMFCRIGYCPDQEHTPRRELSTIIRT
jgi:hypothetical protein